MRAVVWTGLIARLGRGLRATRGERLRRRSRGLVNHVRYRALMADRNRRFLLRERPTGRIGPDTFELSEEPVPEIGDGEALVRVDWISLDPTNRAWINDTPTYLPPVGIGEVMRAGGLGEVVASNNPNYPVGQTLSGFHRLAGVRRSRRTRCRCCPVDVAEGVSPSAYLGALGMTGLTAWIGIRDIGKPKPGETVVVSAAAGAVGSVAGQLAKADGARVVGIAGGAEKCALLTDQLGFDAAVDYKADDWRRQLAEATPDGIDVDFENVGGDIMDAIFARLNVRARVALCGLISGYNDGRPAARTARVRRTCSSSARRCRASSSSTTSARRRRRSARSPA